MSEKRTLTKTELEELIMNSKSLIDGNGDSPLHKKFWIGKVENMNANELEILKDILNKEKVSLAALKIKPKKTKLF